MKTRLFAAAFLCTAWLGAGSAAMAFPDKPVNYVIPFSPGGESDVTARMQQPFFSEFTGQELVIQYKPGAGGAQAWSTLNRSSGDGYTIMGTLLPHIILQPMQKNVGFKTEDLTSIYFFHYTPDAIIVPADSPFETLDDLIEYAKENPGAVTFSGSGTYSANHIAQQRLDRAAGIQTTYIPFAGTAPAVAAMLGNQVTASMGYTTTAIGQGDQVRTLAIAMDERHRLFPDVPTFKEFGYDLVGGAYRGIAVPSATPEALRRELSGLIDRINKDPRFIQQMEESGYVVTNVGYDDVEDFMDARRAEYLEISRIMGIAQQ